MSKTFKRIIGVSVGAIVVTGLVLLIDKQVRKMINKKSVLDDDNDPFAADFDWNEEDDGQEIPGMGAFDADALAFIRVHAASSGRSQENGAPDLYLYPAGL